MANMSYCRFQNTRADLNDCLDALREGKLLSKCEAKSGRCMFDEFLEFCRENFIIADYDLGEIESFFEAVTEGGEGDE